MLTAAICGNVFASPSYQDIVNSVYHARSSSGILLLIKNYTGDVVNFRLAQEICQERWDLKIASIVIGDDIALGGGDSARGIAGTVLLYKILGAEAEKGMDLETLVSYGQNILANIGTMGVCLYPCSKPGFGKIFELEEDKIELGMGIHGEKGCLRRGTGSSKELTTIMLEKILGFVNKENCLKSEMVLMVNNLGSTTDIEMSVVLKDCLEFLEIEKGLKVRRALSGKFLSALEMSGVSLTLLSLTDKNSEQILNGIDYQTQWDTLFKIGETNYQTLEQIDSNLQ